MGSTQSLSVHVLLLFGCLNPSICAMLCSAFFLIASAGVSDTEQRRLTIFTEVTIILGSQWLSPILIGVLIKDAIVWVFPVYAACFGVAATASALSCWIVPQSTALRYSDCAPIGNNV